MADLTGMTLGPYRIIERIGRGGMATVYKAYHPAMDRVVAIKILPEEFADDPGFLTRFEREAKVVAKLQHPFILPVFDYGEERGISYLVMPYIPTGTLKEYLAQRGALTLKEAARIITQLARALDYAHRQGVLHRDIKPGNVLFDAEGNALLTDFGLTRMVEGSSSLTGSGMVIGTPAYMSPEQGQGQPVDTRSDLYSLGVILYEMVTHVVPYSADTPIAVIFKHISDSLPLPRSQRPDLPELAQNVILKALAKRPEDRYPTCVEMAEAFARAIAEPRIAPEPPAEQEVVTKPTPVEVEDAETVAGVQTEIAVSAQRAPDFPAPPPAPPPESDAFPEELESPESLEDVETIAEAPSPEGNPFEQAIKLIFGVVVAGLVMTAAYMVVESGVLSPDQIDPTVPSTPVPAMTSPPNPLDYWADNPIAANVDWTPVIQDFDGVEMVLVPAGCFLMGSTDEQIDYAVSLGGQRDWFTDEQPTTVICFAEPFWLDRYEVTNAQFAAFLNAAGNISPEGIEYLDAGDEDARIQQSGGQWRVTGDYERHPVTQVTWYGGRDYCQGLGGRLPTEAQWEYAARGPDGLIYPWGNEFNWNNVVGNTTGTAERGNIPGGASWVGAYDLSGNVWEWVSTISEAYPYAAGDGREDMERTGVLRVLRGGSWVDFSLDLFRAADRGGDFPDYAAGDLGFRCARLP